MSYKLIQTGQRVQELLNKIDNNEQSQVTNAVLYSEQALNEKEKEQARKNIGAAAENQISTGTVLYSQAQNLTDAEKNQARKNIGALGTEQLPKKVSELENDAGYTTSAEVEQLIPAIPASLPQTSSNIVQGELPTNGWVKDTWQNASFPLSGYYWTDVAYGDGKFVAVAERSGGTSSTISAKQGVYSKDGITWKTMNLPSAQHWGKVCYGAGVFVTLSNGNIIPGVGDTTDSFAGAWSTDGTSWTQFKAPLKTGFGPLVFGNDKFLAITNKSGITSHPYMYSTDGKSWVSQTGFPIVCADITYGAGRFVAVADHGVIAYSNDGLSWTESPLSNAPDTPWYGRNLQRCRICYGQGKFVILTQNTNTRRTACCYSTDGLNWSWTMLPQPVHDSNFHATSIAYGNGVFIAVDDSQFYGSSQCLYSYDGVNWSLCDFTGSGSWVKVVYGNDRFIALDTVGYSDSTGVNYWVATPSLNKYTYTILDSELDAHSDVVMALEDENTISPATIQDQYMVVMRDTAPSTPITYEYKRKQTSGKGQFTIVNSFIPTMPEIPTRVSQLENDAHYVTANQVPVALPQTTGAIQSGVLPTIEWDTLGWKQNTLPAQQTWTTVTYGNGKFVAVTGNGSHGAYSTDGINWTETTMPTGMNWQGVTYGNGKFVAVAYKSNKGAYSTDGITWTEVTMPISQKWTTVTYGNGKFVALSYGSITGVYSTDGINWTTMTLSELPVYDAWESVTYGNGKYVTVAYDSAHGAYSTDGINWSLMTMPARRNWCTVTYCGDKFVALAYDSAHGAYSTDGITWTEMTMPTNTMWSNITYGNGNFIAVASTGSHGAYSTDGINWIAMTMPANIYLCATYGNGKFVAVASNSANGAYWEVADGAHREAFKGVIYSIYDTDITANSDVLMELTDEGGVRTHALVSRKITVVRDTVPTQPIPYTYKVKQTNASGQFTLVNHFVPKVPNTIVESVNGQTGAVTITMPTKTSELTNDSGFITRAAVPTRVSQLDNDRNFTSNIGTVTQVKINGHIKNPQPSGLVDLGNITPEPTDWTTVPITTALENGKTYVVKLDTTPYPLTAIFTMSENLDAIDANVVGGTQQGTDGASTYELKSATITVKDGKLIGLKSTNLVSSANPGAANLAYSESTFADLGITQYHYIELLNSVGGGMSGKGVNYTAIKDTLAIDKWTTDEIHIEGEFLPTTEIVLATFDDTVQHTIDKTKENTLLIGHATADELKNIGYWAFDEQSVTVNATFATDPNTNNPLQMPFIETTDAYFKYAQISNASDMVALYVYKSDSATYKAGDIVFVISADMSATAPDWIKCNTLTPSSEFSGFPAVRFYGYEFPSDLTGTSITIDVLCTKTDSPDIRKTLLLPYVGAEDIQPGEKVHLYVYEPTEEEAQAFPMFFAAQVLTSNVPGVAPAGTVVINGNSEGSGSESTYVFSKLFSLTTSGMAPVTYTYLNENIKLESAIKVYLNDSENIQIIDRQEGFVQFKRAKVANIPFNMEILDTEEEGLLRLFNSYKEPVPTKLSQFQNDTKYLTADNLDYDSPISLTKSSGGTVTIGISSSRRIAFSQYSSSPTSGVLTVDKWVKESDYYVYTISDYSIYSNTDVIMNVNTATALSALSLSSDTLKIKATTKPTEPIDYSYKILSTDTSGQFTIVNGYIPSISSVPTKTSELQNDSGFITQSDIPTKTSQLTNDSNFAVTADIPTKTSDLQNDSGYVTGAELEDVQRIEAWKHSDSDKKAALTKAGTYQTFGEYPIIENDSTINYKWYGEIYFDGTSAAIGTSGNYNKFNSQTSQLTMVTATPKITADENGKMLLRVEILNYRIGESPVTATTDYIAFKYRKITDGGIDPTKIYGVDLVGSENPNALIRTDDAVGLNVTVGTSEITSDFDNCYPWNKIEEVTDDAGNVFIKIPKFYSKITKNADGTYKHQLSETKHDGFDTLFKVGENEIDYVMVGKYEGSGSSSRVYSKSGQTVLTNITLDNFRTGCKANGVGYQQYDFLIDLIIKELWLVEMKTTNSQSIMYGYADNESARLATGETDTVKTSSGSAVSNSDGKHAMKYRGIENLWGNVDAWCDGISFNGSWVYVCTEPASYAAGKTAGPYVLYGKQRPSSEGYVKKVEPLQQNSLIQYATEAGGSATTYFCDGVSHVGPVTAGSVLTVGGTRLGSTMYTGLWYWCGSYSESHTDSRCGGRLCYKPL